ncbi:hypothetical protein ACE6H2_026922 [Prunus campanulata]
MASSLSFVPAPPSVQAHRCSSSPSPRQEVYYCVGLRTSFLKNWDVTGVSSSKRFGSTTHMNWKRRRTLICAVNQDAEGAFKKTVEVDRLIDKLRDANPIEKDYEELAISIMSIVDRLVHKTNEKIDSATDVLKGILKPVVDEVEEIQWPPRDPEALKLMEKELVQREEDGQLDEGFLSEVNAQLRQAKGDGDKPGFEAMLQKVLQLYASTVLSKRSYAKKVFFMLVSVFIPMSIFRTKKRKKRGRITPEEGLEPGHKISSTLAWAAKLVTSLAPVEDVVDLIMGLEEDIRELNVGDCDTPILLGDEILKAEQFLETIIKGPYAKKFDPKGFSHGFAVAKTVMGGAPEEEWNKLLLNGLTLGKGEILPQELYAVIKKRVERTLIRTVRNNLGGRFIPATCSYGVSQWHPIESRANCPTTSGQAAIVYVHDLKLWTWEFGITRHCWLHNSLLVPKVKTNHFRE